jgi:CRISPR-associated protein Cas1
MAEADETSHDASMPTACVSAPSCHVRLVSERLQIHGRDESGAAVMLREIPIRDLDRLLAVEGTQISGEALAALLRSGIPVAFLGWNGRYLGGFQPTTPAHGAWRIRQYRASLDGDFCLAIAGRLVAAKIYNQRRVVQRLAANRGSDASGDLAHLDALLREALKSSSIETLRGYEGAASARYFPAWAGFLPDGVAFERRSTRPPMNPVNACISFGATLLYHEAVSAIHARGLDPALGLLHATEDGRWSLALDLIEPFRPVLVEALALDLFSHQILNPSSHFRPHEGGIYLNDEGRAKFIVQYERRMERQFMSEFAGHRTTLRQQLEDSVTRLKSALEDPSAFEAFVMN